MNIAILNINGANSILFDATPEGLAKEIPKLVHREGAARYILTINIPDEEFLEKITGEFEGIATSDPVKALEWVVEKGSAREAIDLIDHESATENYLRDKGYKVFADKESAIEELTPEFFRSLGGPTVIHGQYLVALPDLIEQFLKTKGALQLCDLITDNL